MVDISVDGMAMPITPDVTMPNTPRPAAGAATEGSAAKRQRTEVDNDVVMNASDIGTIAALLVEPARHQSLERQTSVAFTEVSSRSTS